MPPIALFIIGLLTGAAAAVGGAILARALIVPRMARRRFMRRPVTMRYRLFTAASLRNLITLAVPWTEPFISLRGAGSLLGDLRRRAEDVMPPLASSPSGVATNADRPATSPRFLIEREQYAQLVATRPPPGPVSLPGEYSRLDGVLLAWPTHYPTRWEAHAALIGEIARVSSPLVITPSHEVAVDVVRRVERQFGTADGVRFLTCPVDDVWTRDYGPTLVCCAGGAWAVIANPYVPLEHPYQKGDNIVSVVVGQFLGWPVYQLPMLVEGGNLVTDGAGTMFMFDSVFERNPELDAAAVRRIVQEYFGCDRTLFFEGLPGEITGHVDMVVRFIDSATAVVAAAPRGHSWRIPFDNVARQLSELKTKEGRPIKVVRVPIATKPRSHAFWSYINSVQVNGTTIMPTWDQPTDGAAAAIFRSLTGGPLVGIDFRDFPVGSIHCQTKELPAGTLGATPAATADS